MPIRQAEYAITEGRIQADFTYTLRISDSTRRLRMDFNASKPPEPVRSGAFTYSKDGIKVGGISRADVYELRLLFHKNVLKACVRAATKP